jgi:hypothetical protein
MRWNNQEDQSVQCTTIKRKNERAQKWKEREQKEGVFVEKTKEDLRARSRMREIVRI